MLLHAGRYARRRRIAIRLVAVASAVALTGCGDSVGASDDSFDVEFDFSNDYQGWSPSFADYPVGKENEWAIGSSLAPLPAPLDPSRKGILLTGVNHSDDLFMYITREAPRLAPNASYAVRFRVTVATNAPKNCSGVGGAPGESVVVKVGATPFEPARTVDASQYYRTNFDYGSQLSGGRDAEPVGNIANSNANCTVPRYELKELDSAPLTFATDASGRLWFVIGFDSGFEGTTAVYITAVKVAIAPA
jgi:hypothetical protein